MTKLNNLSNEIMKELIKYSSDIKEEAEVIKKDVATNLRKTLRKTSPKRKGGSGDYSKGWRIKKYDKGWIVHNKTRYQLTHLLEYGHAKTGGGRVAARIHIAPAEDEAIRDYTARIYKVIKK